MSPFEDDDEWFDRNFLPNPHKKQQGEPDMKLNLIIRNALKRQGVKAETIEAALTAIQPKRIHFKREMVRRIEDMVAREGVAVVTRKQVASWKGYQVRKTNTAHLNGNLAKARAAKKAKATKPKTPADIARSLPHA